MGSARRGQGYSELQEWLKVGDGTRTLGGSQRLDVEARGGAVWSERAGALSGTDDIFVAAQALLVAR